MRHERARVSVDSLYPRPTCPLPPGLQVLQRPVPMPLPSPPKFSASGRKACGMTDRPPWLANRIADLALQVARDRRFRERIQVIADNPLTDQKAREALQRALEETK